MSNEQKYFDLIKHNEILFDLLNSRYPLHLEKENFSDWKVTVIFYILCIYLKATILCLYNEDIQDHSALRKKINTENKLCLIARSYRKIEEASRDARYEGRKFEIDYMINRLLPKFNEIRDCVIKLMNEKGIQNIPNVELSKYLKK